MPNERNTENIVRDHFKNDPLFNIIKWEEQKSMNKRVIEVLQWGKSGGKWIAKPEFLITFPQGNMDYLIVIECKASPKDHESKNPAERTNEKAVKYAVDGVLYYAEKLKEEYDVIAIAISGETQSELMVSNFHWKKWAKSSEKLSDNELLGINDYLKIFANEQFAESLKQVDIIQKAIALNEEYQAYSITEMTRCTIVSAILLALTNETFRASYHTLSDSPDIAKALLSAIETVLKQHEVRNKNEMIGEYSKIANEPIFRQNEVKHSRKKEREKSVEVVKEMIRYLHKNVYPLTQMEQSGLDVLGRFYTEFIRYAGGEWGQWLVLTPAHVTDLFCDLASVDRDSIVYDPCCGTGGFLISAMKRMLASAGWDEDKKLEIRKNQLIGVELRPSMFTYACSNMMMRWDGKSNIYCGDCFPYEDIIKNTHKPTVAFLNPPYDVGTAWQMQFIEHTLNVVAPQKWWVVAIVQMSVGIKNEKDLIAAKKRVLQNHRLHAVLSMPDELFNPSATVVTSIMVFRAGEKHEWRKTWFGYFKDDGFEKRKHKGRIDARGKWKSIKKTWLDAYHNLDEISGLSVKAEVRAEDEWCAEAYMETDYMTLTDRDFEKKMNDYIAFKFLTGLK
jgi:type I restriction enzyme M protein